MCWKPNIHEINFENIDSSKLEASGLKQEKSLHLENANYYISLFLTTWKETFEKFHIKGLNIRDSKDTIDKDSTISDETFTTICKNLVSKKLKSIHLYDFDLSKKEEAKEASPKMEVLKGCIKDVKNDSKFPLEVRLNNCDLYDDFSFIDFSGEEEPIDVRITILSLVECGITDQSLGRLIEHTANLASLKIMNLQGNKITLKGVEKLIENDGSYKSNVIVYLHSNRDPDDGSLIDKEQFNEIVKDLKDTKLSISV
jgi:hypothetical protein